MGLTVRSGKKAYQSNVRKRASGGICQPVKLTLFKLAFFLQCEEGDGGGDGGVEGVDASVLGDGEDGVSGLEDELVRAFILSADDEEEGLMGRRGKLVEGDGAFEVKDSDMKAGFDGGLNVGRGVGIAGDVEEFGSAGGDLDDGRIDFGNPFVGEEDVVKAEDIGGTENGADVVRILDIVEQENPIGGGEHFLTGMIGEAATLKDGVLVFGGTGNLVKATFIGPFDGDGQLFEEA